LRVQQVKQIQAGIARRKAYEQWRVNFEQTMEECFLADETSREEKRRRSRRGAVPRRSTGGADFRFLRAMLPASRIFHWHLRGW